MQKDEICIRPLARRGTLAAPLRPYRSRCISVPRCPAGSTERPNSLRFHCGVLGENGLLHKADAYRSMVARCQSAVSHPRPLRARYPPANFRLPGRYNCRQSTFNDDRCGLLAGGAPASRRYARRARRSECLPQPLLHIHRPVARNAGRQPACRARVLACAAADGQTR